MTKTVKQEGSTEKKGGEGTPEKQVGTVKFFNSQKRFGFISGEDGDYFVHISGIKGNEEREEGNKIYLKEGDRVSFIKAEGEAGKGPKAIEVEVITEEQEGSTEKKGGEGTPEKIEE